MIWNITFKDCCLENCLSIWASQNMVYGCCCFIGNPSGFICGWYHDVFTDFMEKLLYYFLHILYDQERWGWNQLRHESAYLNLLFVKMFSSDSIWPLGCPCKTLKIVFFLFLKRISTENGATSSEFMPKPFRILNSTDWWTYSENPPSFFAFSLDEYLYSF